MSFQLSATAGAKAFCFFFSKKKALLPPEFASPHPSRSSRATPPDARADHWTTQLPSSPRRSAAGTSLPSPSTAPSAPAYSACRAGSTRWWGPYSVLACLAGGILMGLGRRLLRRWRPAGCPAPAAPTSTPTRRSGRAPLSSPAGWRSVTRLLAYASITNLAVGYASGVLPAPCPPGLAHRGHHPAYLGAGRHHRLRRRTLRAGQRCLHPGQAGAAGRLRGGRFSRFSGRCIQAPCRRPRPWRTGRRPWCCCCSG